MSLLSISKESFKNLKEDLRHSLLAQAGFTMIELLVVISVIGILSVAVISSINPIEQINKGRDTRKRSNAAQLINALDRFYAINEKYPWNDATYATDLTSDTQPATAFPDDTACADSSGFCEIGGTGYDNTAEGEWLDGLTMTEEVKTSFVNQLEDTSSTNKLFLAKEENEDVYVCYKPASKQFQQEAVDSCINRSDLPANACPQDTYEDTTPWDEDMICLP